MESMFELVRPSTGSEIYPAEKWPVCIRPATPPLTPTSETQSKASAQGGNRDFVQELLSLALRAPTHCPRKQEQGERSNSTGLPGAAEDSTKPASAVQQVADNSDSLAPKATPADTSSFCQGKSSIETKESEPLSISKIIGPESLETFQHLSKSEQTLEEDESKPSNTVVLKENPASDKEVIATEIEKKEGNRDSEDVLVHRSTFGGVGCRNIRQSSKSRKAVTVELDSSNIYRRDKKLYVGKMKELPPPVDMETKWIETIRPRLIKDLKPVIQQLPRSSTSGQEFFEPELCMSGYVTAKEKTVDLKPTLWLRCGSKRCKKAVRNAVEDLTYLKAFSQGAIEIRTRGPRPAASDPDDNADFEAVSLNDSSFRTDNGCLVHLHFQRTLTQSSACGLRFLVTVTKDGKIISQRQSTIGGLIVVGEVVFGITTAHGVLDDSHLRSSGVDSKLDSEDSMSASDSDGDSSICGYDDDKKDSERSRVEKQTIYAEQWTHAWPNSPNSKVQKLKWDMLRSCGPMVYNGRELSVKFTAKETWPDCSADFALLDLGLRAEFVLNNRYKPLDSIDEQVVDDVIHDENLSEGPVSIITGQGHAIEGHLLSSPSMYMSRDAICNTRKIQLESPLAPGTSGSWVVRGNSLCGVILAVYEADPYAHMMTVDKLFSDIMSANAAALKDLRVATEDDIKQQAIARTGFWSIPTPDFGGEQPLDVVSHETTVAGEYAIPYSPDSWKTTAVSNFENLRKAEINRAHRRSLLKYTVWLVITFIALCGLWLGVWLAVRSFNISTPEKRFRTVWFICTAIAGGVGVVGVLCLTWRLIVFGSLEVIRNLPRWFRTRYNRHPRFFFWLETCIIWISLLFSVAWLIVLSIRSGSSFGTTILPTSLLSVILYASITATYHRIRTLFKRPRRPRRKEESRKEKGSWTIHDFDDDVELMLNQHLIAKEHTSHKW